MNEKSAFSNRLRAAMTAAGYAASPSVLEHEFNLRWYGGRPISNQAAWSWLNARSIPTQDKIQLLAEWLKVEPEVLRFGEVVRKAVQAHRYRWETGAGHIERDTFDTFLQLPSEQRKIAREVILALAKAMEVDKVQRPSPTGKDRGALEKPDCQQCVKHQEPS